MMQRVPIPATGSGPQHHQAIFVRTPVPISSARSPATARGVIAYQCRRTVLLAAIATKAASPRQSEKMPSVQRRTISLRTKSGVGNGRTGAKNWMAVAIVVASPGPTIATDY